MTHTRVHCSCIGDEITSISDAVKVAKALGEDLDLVFNDNSTLRVRHTSDVQDLIQIRIYQIQEKK